jgi:hypothetical protein
MAFTHNSELFCQLCGFDAGLPGSRWYCIVLLAIVCREIEKSARLLLEAGFGCTFQQTGEIGFVDLGRPSPDGTWLRRRSRAGSRRWGMALTESPPVRQWADWSELVGGSRSFPAARAQRQVTTAFRCLSSVCMGRIIEIATQIIQKNLINY